MNSLRKETFRISLEVKSPLFIGSGQKYKRINYINDFKNNKIFILDENKWMGFLIEKNAVDLFINYINEKKDKIDINEFIKRNERLFRVTNLAVFYQTISTHSLDTRHLEKVRNNDIDAFIKDYQKNPYIPGSSIKGAISSAVLKKLISEDEKELNNAKGFLNNYHERNQKAAKSENRKLMDKLDYTKQVTPDKTKGMAGIQISDSSSFPLDKLRIYKKTDIAPKRIDDHNPEDKSSSIPLYRECADVGTIVEFKLGIDYTKLNEAFHINHIDDLLQILSDSFDMVYGTEGVISDYKLIGKYLPANSQSEVLIQLGGGAGFHSKTVISGLKTDTKEKNRITAKILSVRAPRHKHDKGVRVISPRCLKVTDVKGKKMLMGICQLSRI